MKTTPVNLGIMDGEVSHEEINRSIEGADRAILFGQQTRLPHFPDDVRLPRLHAADPSVLFFWRVLKKVPPQLREALVSGPISLTLVRGDTLLHYRDVRHHQAVHIGRRRRTIYLPQLLLQQAEEKGYNHWSIAEGVIFAAWMLLDYLLLVDIVTDFGARRRPHGRQRNGNGNGHAHGGSLRLSEPLLRHLVLEHNRHRRVHPEASKSETEEFVNGYRSALIQVQDVNIWTREPWEIARDMFDAERETRWATSKMQRIADVFDFPRMFLFDRDIIHGAAHELAQRKGQVVEPASFADALHDYRDALRFDPQPLMTEFCRGIVPKPRAVFLESVLELGAPSLRGFFVAYRDGVEEAHELIHALWAYLVSLSSDPAGVYARFGKCRALCRPPGARIAGSTVQETSLLAETSELDRLLAGILVRLDRRPDYRKATASLVDLGESIREELLEVVSHHGLDDTDEWATFKIKKQAIVSCACELLDRLDGGDTEEGVAQLAERRRVHEDEDLQSTLDDNPHRLTSDPSAVLMLVRSYRRTLKEFGPSDPDVNCQLASILVRLDLSSRYDDLLSRIARLGPPAISALYDVLEQIPERDEKRRVILHRARQLLGQILLEKQLRSRAQQRARGARDLETAEPALQATTEAADEGDGFVGLQRELLTGTGYLQRGAEDEDEETE